MAKEVPGKSNWRTSPNRRPAAFGSTRLTDDILQPPTMSRSRVQIATSYAPGVLLTWEGGKGICRSVPLSNDISNKLGSTTIDLIFENMRDFVSNWRQRARKALPEAPIEFILDAPFRDSRSGVVNIERRSFELTDPGKVGYVPYPLLFRCGVCGSIREFHSIDDLARRPLPKKCNGHTARWTQVDVVYVHWSGNLLPLGPFNYNFDSSTGEARQIRMCTCGSQNFRLRNEAPIFSEWRYICEGCGDTRPLKKADPEVLAKLQSEKDSTGTEFEWIAVNMLPVSYRANSAFYPQRTGFIEFQDDGVVALMAQDHVNELTKKLAEIHQIPFVEPSEEDIREAVTASTKHQGDWEDYEAFQNMATRADQDNRQDRARSYRQSASEIRESWFANGLVARGKLGSEEITQGVVARQDWTQRFDPIRLTIQHDAFLREHVHEAIANHGAVDVMEPDITLSNVVNDPAALHQYQNTVGNLLDRMGLDQLVLVRGLPICEFSFGFTRVSSSPIYHREFKGRSVKMPVRLKAFDQLPVAGPKYPVYVTQQKNEALYFRVDEARVRRWLQINQVSDIPDYGLGRAYLEQYADFGHFLEMFKDRERGGVYPRTLPAYVYLLLHSLSHQMIHSLADTSGVDRDGIGEYIFPADLAFVIYRKGMTPDLGNISAMWRNHAREFLQRALDPRMLRCGSGSLCDVRGGACPACIMVSEINCVASNLLLSRASLKGGTNPEWEPSDAPDIIGFFDPRCIND
ncbi:hypothetical protein [Kordiimonas lacus]|uniref:DUF1998 domain-containing protein n=1 Tax=Kordiimonas lacus TaxID=637679 RepID=A0A1G7E197_9PROT|nr:hypothetical protein [Kordiimonas lacus]SDE57270.1 hypothetical protein SAMN04488071_3232 [Kordiimonas lacus]